MTSLLDDGDFDFDDDDDDGSLGEIDHNWLESEDPELVEDLDIEKEKKLEESLKETRVSTIQKSQYIIDNKDLFYALCEVEDWEFKDMDDEVQEETMKSLELQTYQPGENIIVEGTEGSEFYIVVASEETAAYAEVEVVKKTDKWESQQNNVSFEDQKEGTNSTAEEFITRMRHGAIFGHKRFITRRPAPRQATVRVPSDLEVPVVIACLKQEHFSSKMWEAFRNLLLIKVHISFSHI